MAEYLDPSFRTPDELNGYSENAGAGLDAEEGRLAPMLLDYYQLAEQPFGVTPDSRFLYLGPKHREALASLVYGTESNRGFLALIAKPGMGKTSLLYHYLSYLRDKARTAFVFRTDCDSREFIRHLLLDLGIDVAGMDLPAMHDSLEQAAHRGDARRPPLRAGD